MRVRAHLRYYKTLLAYWWAFTAHRSFCMVCDRALWRWERNHYRRHLEHAARWGSR